MFKVQINNNEWVDFDKFDTQEEVEDKLSGEKLTGFENDTKWRKKWAQSHQ